MSREASLGTLRRLAPLLPVACALFAWAPLLDNYFKGDDFVDLYELATKPFLRLRVLTSPIIPSTDVQSASWCPRTTGSAPGTRRPHPHQP